MLEASLIVERPESAPHLVFHKGNTLGAHENEWVMPPAGQTMLLR